MNKLGAYLSESGLSQREFAAAIAVHQSVLSRFVGGTARPSLETAFAIERATAGAVPASSWVPAVTPDDASAEDAA